MLRVGCCAGSPSCASLSIAFLALCFIVPFLALTVATTRSNGLNLCVVQRSGKHFGLNTARRSWSCVRILSSRPPQDVCSLQYCDPQQRPSHLLMLVLELSASIPTANALHKTWHVTATHHGQAAMNRMFCKTATTRSSK